MEPAWSTVDVKTKRKEKMVAVLHTILGKSLRMPCFQTKSCQTIPGTPVGQIDGSTRWASYNCLRTEMLAITNTIVMVSTSYELFL
jgi:hypothetical protein